METCIDIDTSDDDNNNSDNNNNVIRKQQQKTKERILSPNPPGSDHQPQTGQG